MDLAGILVALAALVYLAFRGWSVLLLAPATALVAAGFAGEPLLALVVVIPIGGFVGSF
jgi:H+/gluconate symporter-like permease